MRHVQQNIFLDKDEGGKCSMFRQAEGFVKKQKKTSFPALRPNAVGRFHLILV